MNFLGILLLLFQLQPATVSGTVTKPDGREPLAGAMVILYPSGATQASRIRSAISEDDGRFAVLDIEPGEYRIEVQSPFYGVVAYGQRKPGGPGTIVTLAAGQRLSDLKLSMVPTGTISGRVTGRTGEPLVYATVQALKYLYQDGKRVLSVAQNTITDDRGEYRLFWLNAGKYIVVSAPRNYPIGTTAVGPQRPGEAIRGNSSLPISLRGFTSGVAEALLDGANQVKRILEDGTSQEEAWMPTYYPATTDRTQAVPVEVTGSSTVVGINLTLGPSPVQRVRGRVTNPAVQTTVSLASATQGTSGRAITVGASLQDGSFQFGGVAPGPYVLTAQGGIGLSSAAVAVLVEDRDVEGVAIALVPPITVTVNISAEGVAASALTGFTGALRPDVDPLPGGFSMSNLRATNAVLVGNVMTFVGVQPGDYQFHINQIVVREQRDNPQPLYIKSVRVGREDAMNTLHVSSSLTEPVEVVLTTGKGSLDGVALNRSGNPAASATVVLVPTTARKRLTLYQTVVTGSDGKFKFPEVPPGDYKLFAWDDIETGAWANAEFLQPYELRGRAVRVSETSKEEVQLSVIYNP
jgi:hypothetical protein